MITFRKIDYEKDVPEVAELLRSSLSDRHTVSSFLWKHCDNPFGSSIGFLAFDDEKLVGVRMFMCWEFESEKGKFKAFRPVDSVTHVQYRGRGVFKRLTSLVLEEIAGNYDIIFNTPNTKSSPGNLKMGWKKYQSNGSLKTGFFFPTRVPGKVQESLLQKIDFSLFRAERPGIRTRKDKAYFLWRYKESKYKAALFGLESDFTNAVIYKVDKIKGIKTLIVYEFLGEPRNFRPMVRSLLRRLGLSLVHCLQNDWVQIKPHLSISKEPPLVLFRDDTAQISKNLVFSLGDLEGRI